MATIKLKSKREPVDIQHIKAVELKKKWLGTDGERQRDKTEKFSLGDNFAGNYGQIEWINTTQEYKRTEKKQISNQENKDFESKYLRTYLNTRGYLVLERELDFLADRGCITLRKLKPEGKCYTVSDFKMIIIGKMVEQYENYTNLIQAWKEYNSRVNYVKKQDLQQLDKST